MIREYTIIIEAPAAHQPSQDEIFQDVTKRVDARVKEFPKRKGGRSITMIPRRNRPKNEIVKLK